MNDMKRILGDIRRADRDYHMIRSGDRVAVGLSGGKDSLLLLWALAVYRRFSPGPFDLEAITVHPGFERFDLRPIEDLCQGLGVPYTVEKTRIYHIVFEARHESNPCALCANMRRGALMDVCRKRGVTKLALGHHRDDAIATLLMSVLREGRFRTLQPMTRFDEGDIALIRPLICTAEKDIRHAVRVLRLPVIESPCPANGQTERSGMEDLMRLVCQKIPNAREMILSALKNDARYELWNRPEDR